MLKTLGNILIIGGALAVLFGLILKLTGRFKWIGKLLIFAANRNFFNKRTT